MKFAFISPKGSFLSNNPEFRSFWESEPEIAGHRYFWSGFSLGLLTIAALLSNRFKAKVIDENFEDINFNEDFDLVAISTMTQQADRAYQIAKEFRIRKTKVVIGGIHPTLLPSEAKKNADSVFIGEGENIWPKFIKDFLNDDIQSFYKSSTLVDLTKSPIPRFDLLNSKYYRMVWIQTTRGCPIDCEFCSASKIFGLKFRHKSIRQVITEIKLVKSIWKPLHINFADDNMFIDRRFAEELVKAIIPLKIWFTAQTDISIANNDYLLSLLRKAGCERLFIGFESLTKKNLQNIDRRGWKCKYLDNYTLAIQKIQSYGIGIMGAFIIGFDGDDLSSFDRLSNFIIENNLFGAQVTILTPTPGTRLRDRMMKEGRILPDSWKNYTGFDVNFIPKKMSSKDLQRGLLKIYKRIYTSEVRAKKVEFFKNIYLRMPLRDKSYN